MVRYADDMVLLCDSQTEAEGRLERVRTWAAEAGLTLHPEKTRIVDATTTGGLRLSGISLRTRDNDGHDGRVSGS